MDPLFNHIRNTVSGVHLSSEERSAMRDAVLARIRATQSATPRIPSPYAGFFMSLTFQRMSAFVALIAVAVGGMGGVSFAAEDALPGDAMYAVKVHVNEELRSLAAITPAAKAAVATSRVERRLMEAEVLAARGELNEVAAADLSTRFSASAEEASSHIDTLTEKDPDDAATASTEFESVLAAHGRILDNIIVARNGETEETLATLRIEIAERREATERKREEFRIAMLSGEEGRKTSARFYETVTRDAEDAVRELEERSGTALASDALAIETRVAVITEALDEGRAKHELGDYKDAFADFARAKTVIAVGKRLLDAKDRFETEDDTPVEEEVVEETPAIELAAEPAADTAAMMTMSAPAPMAKSVATTSTSTATTTEEVQERKVFRGWSRIKIDLDP